MIRGRRMREASWIGVDWGTSRVRAWAMNEDGGVADRAVSIRGMSTLARDEYEPALLGMVDPWLAPGHCVPIVACGMVGAREGWAEAGYIPAPYEFAGAAPLTEAPTRDDRIQVLIVPGVRQDGPRDVMRGEETLIAGFIGRRPAFDGVICLPGTHAKWVRVSDRRLRDFRSFMTGELFHLLAEHSVLRGIADAEGEDDDAFRSGVETALARPELVTHELFRLRAEAMTGDPRPDSAGAALSGLLIGLELAGARDFWSDGVVVVLGGEPLAERYAAALECAGSTAEIVEAEDLAIAGLRLVHDSLRRKR